jgi:hypothetical protein
VRGRLKDIFAGQKLSDAQEIFEELSNADASLVEFVHTVIFDSLNRVCETTEAAIAERDLERAEAARLQFKVESGPMIKRLEDIGSELADLVLQFKRLASGAPA